MRAIRLQARLLAPVHLAARHTQSNFAATLEYIPGTALRGAMAALYQNREDLRKEVDTRLAPDRRGFEDYFSWLFLSEAVQFPNLYPEALA
ncbi:MAG: hypothetical protein ACE5Q6_13910, partial [Dehalococcoidia bacterium]